MSDQPFLRAGLPVSAPASTPGIHDPLVTERYVTTVTSDPAGTPGTPGTPDVPTIPGVARPGASDLSSVAVEAMLLVAAGHERQVQTQMANLQARVAAKQSLRRLLGQVLQERSTIHEQGRDDPEGYPALVDEAQHLLTQLITEQGELSETESLRLQMAMDRMSKMMSTLSNLLKRIDDTERAIIQNLK